MKKVSLELYASFLFFAFVIRYLIKFVGLVSFTRYKRVLKSRYTKKNVKKQVL